MFLLSTDSTGGSSREEEREDTSGGGNSETDDNIVLSIQTIKSPHEARQYSSFVLSDKTIPTLNKLLVSADEYKENISHSVPWHVNDNCIFIFDFESLKSRLDITVDCWNWTLSKTYVVSAVNEMGALHKRKPQRSVPLGEKDLQM